MKEWFAVVDIPHSSDISLKLPKFNEIWGFKNKLKYPNQWYILNWSESGQSILWLISSQRHLWHWNFFFLGRAEVTVLSWKTLKTLMNNTEDSCTESARLSTYHPSVKANHLVTFFALRTMIAMSTETCFLSLKPCSFSSNALCLDKLSNLLEILLIGTGHLWREKKCKSFQQLMYFVGWKEIGVSKTGSHKCTVLCVSVPHLSVSPLGQDFLRKLTIF